VVVAEEITLEVSGLRIAAKAWGPKDGRKVLALHGWLDNAATFDRLVPLLPSELRIVAVDLPGHGLSQHRSPDAGYALPDAAYDVALLIHTLGWSKCALLGHSMGAAISALLAGTAPELVERLVLVEGLGPLVEEPDGAPARLMNAIGEGLRRRSQTRVFASVDEAAARVVEAAPMEIASAKILLQRGLQAVPGGYTWRTDPRLRTTTRLRFTEGHVRAFLQRIACDTLIVLAEEGWPAPPELNALRKSYIARRSEITVPARHHVHLDAPERIASHIGRHLWP
jgi:pimeloyl-ACP methyl ester carboxylesterase